MYFVNTESLEIVMQAPAATTNPSYVIAYNDMQAAGMVLPQSSSNGLLSGTTPVTVVSSPVVGITRQVAHFTLHNSDTATVTVIIRKDVSGTDYPIKKAILPSNATLEYSRETGWNVITKSFQPTYVFSEYVTNGTWTKPANLKCAWVVCIGAGGGGGSGRRGAAGTNRTGGGGGGGGTLSQMFFDASHLLETSYTITVGVGGTGGAAQTVNDTNGISGTTGTDSSFNTLIVANGGGGGVGGQNAFTVNGGTVLTANTQNNGPRPQGNPFSLIGASGGSGVTNSNSIGSGPFGGSNSGASGVGGSGLNTSNAGLVLVTNSASAYNNTGQILGVQTPDNGQDNVTLNFFCSFYLVGTKGLGIGGAGGGQLFVNGTNAGNYGAGGGGGAGVLNGTNSGAGGNGSNGLVVILEIY